MRQPFVGTVTQTMLRPFIGRRLKLTYAYHLHETRIGGESIIYPVDYPADGILTDVSDYQAMFDAIKEPGEVYGGFNIPLHQIVSFFSPVE